MYFIEVSVPIHQSIMYSRVNDSDFVSSFDFSILFCSDKRGVFVFHFIAILNCQVFVSRLWNIFDIQSTT